MKIGVCEEGLKPDIHNTLVHSSQSRVG